MDYKFMAKPNEQGFEVNITHPDIMPLYAAYKLTHKIGFYCPMSNDQRRDFEKTVAQAEQAEYLAFLKSHGLTQKDKIPIKLQRQWHRRGWRIKK